MIFVDLRSLTSGPFGKNMPTTSGPYPMIVDRADELEWTWSGLTTHDDRNQKEQWWEQYALTNRNKLVFADFCDVAAGNPFISRDLNLCRQFCAAGGRALWFDYPVLRDVSGSNNKFLAACVGEAFSAVR